MTKRYITILPDILVLNLQRLPYYVRGPDDTVGVASKHVGFLLERTGGGGFGLGLDAIQSARTIREALDDLAPGDVLVVDEDDWKRLAAEAAMPTELVNGQLVQIGYNPIAGPQLVPFALAITDAPRNDPRPARDVEAP